MNSQLILLVVAGTVGLMLMAFSLVFFVSLYKRRVLQNKLSIQEIQAEHQQEMLKATLTSQEEERNRLGTELHDGVGALLSTIKLNLQVAQRGQNLEALPEAINHLADTISQVRSISHEMMPVVLKKYGLERAVRDLFEKIDAGGETVASIVSWQDYSFDDEKSLMLYRIIQELTNNCLKHAKASKISIEAKNQNENFSLRFYDNGIGFPKEVLEKAEGMGLWNILNRAQAIGAEVHFTNLDSGGAHVELTIKPQAYGDGA